MSEQDLPEPDIARRETPRRGLSAAWLVPVLAIAIAGTVAWRHYAGLGPTVRIVLEQGAGIEAGRTEIRYRDVTIGTVEELTLGPELERVEATARLDPDVAAHLRADTTFWVVRPQISASGVSGLETLVSGAYLGVDWGEGERVARESYEALAAPPRTPPGTPGRRVTLLAEGGSTLSAGAPVFYKSIEVGQIETERLAENSEAIEYEAFIEAPYHHRIGAGTRFWDSSGIALSVGADGIDLNVGALASLLRGGAEFDTLGTPARARAEDTPFTLFRNRETALRNLQGDDPGTALRFTTRFEGSVRGLSVGAPVEIQGVTIGEVEDLQVRAGGSIGELAVVAVLRVSPGLLGIGTGDPDRGLAFFERSVAGGLRAQLATGNILTGQLYVELAEFPEAGAANLDTGARPYPRLPSAPSDLDRLRGSVQTVLARLQELPLEETLGALNGVLANLETITADDELRRLPGEINSLLASTRAIVSELEAAGLGATLAGAATEAGTAAEALSQATSGMPALVARLNRVAEAADTAIAAYGQGSTLNTEAVTALREIRQAARAVSNLAQTIQRQPNSLILGR